jgi:hypothetical protein
MTWTKYKRSEGTTEDLFADPSRRRILPCVLPYGNKEKIFEDPGELETHRRSSISIFHADVWTDHQKVTQ